MYVNFGRENGCCLVSEFVSTDTRASLSQNVCCYQWLWQIIGVHFALALAQWEVCGNISLKWRKLSQVLNNNRSQERSTVNSAVVDFPLLLGSIYGVTSSFQCFAQWNKHSRESDCVRTVLWQTSGQGKYIRTWSHSLIAKQYTWYAVQICF